MIVLGIDPHKATHTAVAVDVVGRVLGERTVAARSSGHRELQAWAETLGPERTWAVEDCRHVSGLIERDLTAAGETVVRVPPKLMSGRRRASRSFGKSDAIDALAVARAAIAHPQLPQVPAADASAELKLWVDYRDQLVAERTRHQNRLRWQLHDIDPDLNVPRRTLERRSTLDRIAEHLATCPPSARVLIARDLLERIRELNTTVAALERSIAQQVEPFAPELLGLVGCGALTAAKLVGETGDVDRFPADSHYAMHAGASPLDCSSGRQQRHRCNPYGNRQLNAALHRIALTQLRIHQPARDLVARRTAAGDSWREAMRVLKRYLARVVYKLLKQSAARRRALALT